MGKTSKKETVDAATSSALEGRLRDLPKDATWQSRYPVEAMAAACQQMANTLAEPEIAALFATLGTAYPADTPQVLREASARLFELKDKLRATEASAETRKVPANLVDEATEVRSRMRKVVEYQFDDEPEHAAALAELRKGRDYFDLAADLVGYADWYAKHHAVLSKDPKNFRSDDEVRARGLAGDIRASLSGAPTTDPVALELARVQIVGRDAYEDAYAAAQFVLRRYPALRGRFRSLREATVKTTPRRKKPAEEPEKPNDD
jgi:hypothetical protein